MNDTIKKVEIQKRINKHITLKLEDGKTNIYIAGQLFEQCKYLAFQIDPLNSEEYDEISSIDEMEIIDRSSGFRRLGVIPEEEFWGHCSVRHEAA